MKRFSLVALCILMGFLAFGCGKKSGLEGKVVDGKGKPVANVKIIAKQVQPIKGYEQFETTTGSDGTFSFGKLFPTSEYILFPWYEDWSVAPMRTLRYKTNNLVARFNKEGWATEQKMKVQSGPEGETILLTSPIVIQPCISGIEGKVIDGKGLPINNIKIIAKQVKPVPGYERFEATTGPDGSFRFGKLFPHSRYTLLAWYKDGWITEQEMKVQSAPEGEVRAVRFDNDIIGFTVIDEKRKTYKRQNTNRYLTSIILDVEYQYSGNENGFLQALPVLNKDLGPKVGRGYQCPELRRGHHTGQALMQLAIAEDGPDTLETDQIEFVMKSRDASQIFLRKTLPYHKIWYKRPAK